MWLTVTGHARLSRNTGWNEDDLAAGQALPETRRSWVVALDSALGVDVGQISCDTCTTNPVIIFLTCLTLRTNGPGPMRIS